MSQAENDVLIIALLGSDEPAKVEKGTRLLTQLARPLIFKFVLKNSGSPADAEDLLQEVAVLVWQQIRQGKYTQQSDTSLRGYIWTIAHNQWLRELRKRKNRPTTEDFPADIPQEEESATEINLKLLEGALARLDKTCRFILEAFYFEQLDLTEIAKVVGKSYGATKEQKHRCVRQLRDILNRLT
ncbi:RNA polymerase sigma factor [Spirosoma harenae]